MTAPDMTLGEVARRVDRLEGELKTGLREIKEEISRLSFVPAAVYAADRAADAERLQRVELDLREESKLRRAAEDGAKHRSFQAKLALGAAMFGIPCSIAAGVFTANIIR